MIPNMIDHDYYLRAAADPRATDAERAHLAYCASMAAAGEPITRGEYLRAEALTGGALSTVTPIFDRP
ncbi:hypothetical protein [Acidiphilium sp.]|uniref:hypothetical protein n=1 Tax=Acidiphilium sp. TaxID=527 RepID=UPI0025909BF5|nr:hypothetical protein [Acidiphilium sp.]